MRESGIVIVALVFLLGPAAFADVGQAKFDKICSSCHGSEGRADTKKGKKLKAADYREVAKLRGPDALEHVKKTVRENKKHRKASEKVSDQDLAEIAQYVQKLAASPK